MTPLEATLEMRAYRDELPMGGANEEVFILWTVRLPWLQQHPMQRIVYQV